MTWCGVWPRNGEAAAAETAGTETASPLTHTHTNNQAKTSYYEATPTTPCQLLQNILLQVNIKV